MAILVSVHNLTKSVASRTLFDGLTFSVETGERAGLIGPNGAGKSTLLKILASKTSVDSGTVAFQRGLRVGYLEQLPAFTPGASVMSSLLEGAKDPDNWEAMALAHEFMSKLSLDEEHGIDAETLVENLSGGWKKRVALARELMREPDLLLLDEPTNHLDVESILWLEEWLERAPFATLIVTHDRLFLQNVSNRILELDRRNPNGLLEVHGTYSDYLELKDQTMASQERREIVLKNTLRRETEWLRQGAKARTTKQQARIQRAGELKEEVESVESRNQTRTAKIDFQATRGPKKLIEAKDVTKVHNHRTLFSHLDMTLTYGARIGLLGANGCGKSTLIRVLLGLEEPDSGTVVRSDLLKVAYFEQNREALDPDKTVLKTLCPSGDHVKFNGNFVHIRSYMDRFLFSQQQMDSPIRKLSGGEQSRILIAQLMLEEANLLVLDEPTNDLDMATLTVLEDCLREFEGAVLLVTHDRYFLDNVATQILAFPPHADGTVTAFSNLQQWQSWHDRLALAPDPKSAKAASAPASVAPAPKKKLSYKDQREFDAIEEKIRKFEIEMEAAANESQKSDVARSATKLAAITQRMGEIQSEMDKLYARWAELEAAQS